MQASKHIVKLNSSVDNDMFDLIIRHYKESYSDILQSVPSVCSS